MIVHNFAKLITRPSKLDMSHHQKELVNNNNKRPAYVNNYYGPFELREREEEENRVK